ncbi:MAG TPA: ABC transporter ATP-binding protein [Bacillota bacterium]|nr:ABC transporter ATP-binding protein [Bacillota bacterium]
MEQNNILKVTDLSGGYSVRHPVLHQLSFSVRRGEMVGLIGLNGAGKSTTIKHILGLLRPIEGEIKLNGRPREEGVGDYQANISYIPETPVLYEEMNVWEHLEFTAMVYRIPKDELERRGKQLLKEFQMERMISWLPQSFSKGMKQKLMIMCAFLVNPSLFVVDEPFIGLDPKAIHSLLEHLTRCKQQGTGILLSTHILSTAEKYCDRFILLHEGRILLQGTLEELRVKARLPQASLEDLFHQVTEVGHNG